MQYISGTTSVCATWSIHYRDDELCSESIHLSLCFCLPWKWNYFHSPLSWRLQPLYYKKWFRGLKGLVTFQVFDFHFHSQHVSAVLRGVLVVSTTAFFIGECLLVHALMCVIHVDVAFVNPEQQDKCFFRAVWASNVYQNMVKHLFKTENVFVIPC